LAFQKKINQGRHFEKRKSNYTGECQTSGKDWKLVEPRIKFSADNRGTPAGGKG